MTETPSANASIALLIDADNAPAIKIDFIISELAQYGLVNVRRAYGNWKNPKLSGWERVLNDYAIQPIQRFDLIKGKNASDMALLIDAMDLLYRDQVDTFCLVSSDCDFAPIAVRLRADGKTVIGFGDRKTPEPFANSCSRFLYLEGDADTQSPQRVAVRPLTGRALKSDTKLMNLLTTAVQGAEDEEGWAWLGAVGQHISNQGSFDSRNYGARNLTALFEAIDCFEVEKISKGGALRAVRVRDRRAKKNVASGGSA